MKWLLVIALGAFSGSSLTFLLLRRPADTQELPPAPIQPRSGENGIEGIGYVEPASEVRLLSPKTGGVIKECYVKVGDRVRKGDTLLLLHDEKEKVAVTMARRQLEASQAEEAQVKSGINPYRIRAAEKTLAGLQIDHQFAVKDANRKRELYLQKAGSEADMEAAEGRRLRLEASVAQAEAELLHLKNYVRKVDIALIKAKVCQSEAKLAMAEQHLGDLRLRAPFDGTVLKILKRPGEGVCTTLEPVILFGDLSRLRIRTEIDERFVKDVCLGQKAEVYGRNLLGKTYPGRVVEMERIMGGKTVFTRASAERTDLDVLQVVIDMESGFSAPVGLRVDVRIHSRPD